MEHCQRFARIQLRRKTLFKKLKFLHSAAAWSMPSRRHAVSYPEGNIVILDNMYGWAATPMFFTQAEWPIDRYSFQRKLWERPGCAGWS